MKTSLLIMLLLCSATVWSKGLEDRVKELEARVQKLEIAAGVAGIDVNATPTPVEDFVCRLKIGPKTHETRGATLEKARERFSHQCNIVMNQPEIICLKVKCGKE